MKAHTSQFKENITKFGREIDNIITYELNGVTIELGNEELNSVTPHYEGAILKSVMKQLDVDSNVEIPLGTILTYEFGLKVGNGYEYINFGNYVVYNVEKQEDTESYKITCYDKMLYAMKDYENMQITYPQTIRSYINEICNKIGLTFANAEDVFANYEKTIASDLYEGLGYTIRDVLDELAQVTASTICINNNDELEIRYINDTGDIINEKFLKDVNVNFGEMSKPINTIVLSRAGGSDKIYKSYPDDLPDNEKVALEIADNQIMAFNDRDIYLTDILDKLNGLTYCINDFTSTGICYYDLCDRYNVQIGENIYSCIMFNDEINVTQGLEELIYTELLEESETDYTKADKTDRRINQTYIIVDKQNGQIQSLIDNAVSVSDTRTGVGSVTLENAHKGQLYQLSIKGNISLLYPQNEENLYGYTLTPNNNLLPGNNLTPSSSVPYQNAILYPNDNLFGKSSNLIVDGTKYKLDFDFLNYISNDVCDEFIYDNGSCYIIRRVGINDEGERYPLANEVIEPRQDIVININENSTISLESFDNATLKATYLLENVYTDNFTTEVEVQSEINQLADSITSTVSANYVTKGELATTKSEIKQTTDTISLEVSEKVGNDEIISKINQTPETITINANKLNLQGYITASDLSGSGTTTINGSNITTGEIKSSNYVSGTSGTKISLTDGSIDTKNFKVSNTGNITATGGQIGGWDIKDTYLGSLASSQSSSSASSNYFLSQVGKYAYCSMNGSNSDYFYIFLKDQFAVTTAGKLYANNASISGSIYSSSGTIGGWNLSSNKLYGTYSGTQYAIRPYGIDDETNFRSISWGQLINSSDSRLKNNIEKIDDKYEKLFNDLKPSTFYFNKGIDEGKKHIGFVAQDILESEDLINEDLAMVYLGNQYYNLDKQEIIALNTWQIQKLKEEVKLLKYEINELKEKINNGNV